MDPLHQPQASNLRNRLAMASYWLLFILFPAMTLFIWCGFSIRTFFLTFGLLALLMLVGEHVYRPWRRRWGVPKFTSTSPEDNSC